MATEQLKQSRVSLVVDLTTWEDVDVDYEARHLLNAVVLAATLFPTVAEVMPVRVEVEGRVRLYAGGLDSDR